MNTLSCPVRLLVFCFMTLILHPSSFILAQEVRWRHDYNAARREARAQGRPLFVDIGAERCVWCQKLDATTFRDPALVELLNEQFVPLKVDGGREPALVEILRIQAFPTLVLADADGKIIETVEGYVEAPRLRELARRLLAVAAAPAAVPRDYQEAVSAAAAADHARAVERLQRVLADGKARAVQAQARQLLDDIEKQAAARLACLKELAGLGHEPAAVDGLDECARAFAGTSAAAAAVALRDQLAGRPEVKAKLRERRAREVARAAREDFRAKRFLACLERCEVLAADFADLPEAVEGRALVAAIKEHPERLRQVCDALADRLGGFQRLLTEAVEKQGRPADVDEPRQ